MSVAWSRWWFGLILWIQYHTNIHSIHYITIFQNKKFYRCYKIMWTWFFFVFWLFTNFLQGLCITSVIKENKPLSTHSPVFRTGIGGIPFLSPRLKLQMYLLVSRLIIRAGGAGRGMRGPRHLYQRWRNHSQCEGCAIAMATPPHGHTGHIYVPTCSRPASGRPGGSGEVPGHNCPGIGFSAPCTSFTFGGIFCTPDINRGSEVEPSL